MISAIIITRNESNNITRTLRSLIDNRITEIIVSDSNSSDNTADIVTSEANRDSRISFYSYTNPPFTAARGRNEGANHASPKSDYLLFLDGDMELIDGFLDAALLALKENTALAALAGQMHNYLYSDKQELIKKDLNVYCIEDNKPGGAILIRAESFKAANGYNSNLIVNEESELIYRVSKNGSSYRRIDKLMVIHHTESATSRSRLTERLLDKKITALSRNVIVAFSNPGYFHPLIKENINTFLMLFSFATLIIFTLFDQLLYGALFIVCSLIFISIKTESLRTPLNHTVYSIGLAAGLLSHIITHVFKKSDTN